MAILVITFFIGAAVGVFARLRAWSAVLAIPGSYLVSWCVLVMFAVLGTVLDLRPNRGLLGNVLFMGITGLWCALPACIGCALALVGRDPPSTGDLRFR